MLRKTAPGSSGTGKITFHSYFHVERRNCSICSSVPSVCPFRTENVTSLSLFQSQSKTELKFVREVEALPDFGFHLFRVSSEKHGGNVRHLHHGRSSDRLIGINVDGIFLFDQPSSSDPTQPHRVASAYHWNKIARYLYLTTLVFVRAISIII